jgi:hypothetical protein
MEASGEWPLPDGSRVAEFPPQGEQTRAFAVEWYPWVVAHPEPVRIELDLSPLWAVPEGAIVPLGTAFELGGEPLTVTSVQRRGDEMVLVVRNQLDPEARPATSRRTGLGGDRSPSGHGQGLSQHRWEYRIGTGRERRCLRRSFDTRVRASTGGHAARVARSSGHWTARPVPRR